MNSEDQGATKLTVESWRPKFYGLINEGRKYRVSSRAIRHSAWVIGILVVATQIYSSLQPSFKRSTVVLFAPPQLRSDLDVPYVPPLMDARRDATMARDQKTSRARSRPVPIIERIKPINLTGFQGIPPGSETIAQLVSGGANGMVKAQLIDMLKAGGDVLLPRGTVLIGKGSSSDDRLYIAFRKAITPDGQSSKITAQAYDDKDRILGLKGKKVSDYAFKLAASAGLIFLGGMADGMKNNYAQNVFFQTQPTVHDAALNGAATAASDLSHQVMDSMKNQQERVVVDHSTKLIVIFGDTDATE